jgi:hypothetical protein
MHASDVLLICIAAATIINQWLIARYNKQPKRKPKPIAQEAKVGPTLRRAGIVLGISTIILAALLISFAFDTNTPTHWDVLKIAFGVVLGVLTFRDVLWLVMNPSDEV